MAKLEWAFKKEFDPCDQESMKKPLTCSTRVTRNKLFEYLAHLPHMDVRYVKLRAIITTTTS